MTRFVWICLGGAIGTGARYLLSGWALKAFGSGFAWGTLLVNVIGSFLLALIMHVALQTESFSPTLRLMLTTGVMGGFTTYSTFSYETVRYLQDGAWWLAAANVLATVVVCFAATFLGFGAGKWMVG